jgi:uncharacterized protein YaeQ
MMQLTTKVIRLDLQYSSLQTHKFLKQTCYLAPFQEEEALHFAKRMLAYLSLFELQPQLAKQDPAGKQPDLFLRDQHQHFQLWCQVDLPSEKQLLKASHQADYVVLLPDDDEMHRAQMMIKGLKNVRLFSLATEQLYECCDMLKGHMQLSVWRDDDQMIVTDGTHQMDIQLTPLLGSWFEAKLDTDSTFTPRH